MDAIQWVRTESGIEMAVASAARCNRHDDEITFYRTNGKRRTGHRAHTIQDDGFCHALDVRVWGESLEMLEQFLYKLGIITGRGYKQHGPHASRFVHWDNLPRTATRPRPWIWSYA